MCGIYNQQPIGRREFLALAGFGLATSSALLRIGQAAAASGPTTSVTADQALAKARSARPLRSPRPAKSSPIWSRRAK